MGTMRDRVIFVGGGVAFWVAQNPVKRAKLLYTGANFIRFGGASSSVGLGTAGLYAGAGLVGWSLGAFTLMAGTYVAEEIGWAPEGSTDHAVDFVAGDVDNWYDYVPAYNAAKIAKHYF